MQIFEFKKIVCFLFVFLFLFYACYPIGVEAQDSVNTAMLKSRIANFREMGTSFKYINDELKQTNPSLIKIQDEAKHIDLLGEDMLKWFPSDSQPPPKQSVGWFEEIVSWFSSEESAFVLSDDADSDAKPEVWLRPDEFKQAFDEFTVEVRKLRKISKDGDIDAVNKHFKALGHTCKGCHDVFREKSD